MTPLTKNDTTFCWISSSALSTSRTEGKGAKYTQQVFNNLQNTDRNITAKYYCWRQHPQIDQSTRWLVRDLTSPRALQSVTCGVCKPTSPQVGNMRVGESASCPVTMRIWTYMYTWHDGNHIPFYHTHTFYKCRRCTNFVRVSQTQFCKRQLYVDMRKETNKNRRGFETECMKVLSM